ncbi:Type 1 glutamine amidotransferase-like domain-containing protein [Clostridium sp. YIM B02505]|uniref:Type 1 glutamine amidotransferase-like domain-containing protein n=1 Tax=Clostridium yunnanense TaxID=2800325 RepID=A0ABS1EV81_9CLOT|nr:Type 1 glutamine amidotransferase-like domain-containing protein [Clostridium yunnanense]MBK1813239.1 Type 1 glutamine amidotransferase-like domain-containing protein [Clostridium yunnanense]
MLILTSNGLSSDKIIGEMKELCETLSKAVIVTTASAEYKENDWHIPRLTGELKSVGLSVDYFDFDYEKPELLLNYDVIEINGGNPFYLLSSMRKSNCEDIMERLIQEKIVVGVSAGSIVLQKNINLIAQYSPELNKDVHLEDFSGFGFSPIELLPHYSRFITKFDRFEEKAKEYELANNCKVIRIDDGQAVVVNSKDYWII